MSAEENSGGLVQYYEYRRELIFPLYICYDKLWPSQAPEQTSMQPFDIRTTIRNALGHKG